MKLSTVIVTAATIFSLAEGKLQATREEDKLMKNTEGRRLRWCSRWSRWCRNDSSSDDSNDYDDKLVKDCSALSNTGGEVHTSYELTDHIVFTYPCSGSYLTNFAANYNLLSDIRDALGDCANLCNIDNAGYELKSIDVVAHEGSIAELPNGGLWCGDNNNEGVLNTIGDKVGFSATEPCACNPPTYIAGCKICRATVSYKVKDCADSSGYNN